ncbi:hypothetical protein E2C01_002407 [Portunus trituberculatus]|uniref:Uncharacterized protein n=1 Tax=Portunus trituberculatus TaxID=210409 RepID=A0A5B7CJV0_PORTR|nr:hypothetical protein [Portunus trituberculatus]
MKRSINRESVKRELTFQNSSATHVKAQDNPRFKKRNCLLYNRQDSSHTPINSPRPPPLSSHP